MTKLLEKAIEEAKTVPESKQDEVAAHLFEEIQRAKLLAGIEDWRVRGARGPCCFT